MWVRESTHPGVNARTKGNPAQDGSSGLLQADPGSQKQQPQVRF